jgi:BirA family transcriptional regulator, biotin operon repressor / biotin---[acetyl-CoA-carboxylase] ligase
MQFRTVQWHDALPSTNTFLVENLSANPQLPAGTVIAARQQTSGRGRYDRTWVSGPGRDLTFSFLVRARVPLAWMPSLPMAVAITIGQVTRSLGVDTQWKWPNDVLAGGKKICGILSEYVPKGTARGEGEEHTAVVGVGLNVNMTEAETRQIDRPATSILAETGQEHDIETVLDAVLAELPQQIGSWEAGGFEALRSIWESRCFGLGQRISAGEGDHIQTGVLKHFGSSGELILEDDGGVERVILAGDVT